MNKSIEIMTVVYGKKAKEMLTKCSKKAGFELKNYEANFLQMVVILTDIANGKGKPEIRERAKSELEKLETLNEMF